VHDGKQIERAERVELGMVSKPDLIEAARIRGVR
jgi:hypothetical protein